VDLSRYRFRSAWHVYLAADPLFDVLSDISSYPSWWRQVRSVERIDDDTAAVVCRSALPYELRLRAQRACEDRTAGRLEVRLGGDLDGWSRWTLRPEGSGTTLVYDQEVVVHSRLLRGVGLVARPLLRANHAWMMRCGRVGLEHWVRSHASAC
jgi:Polyketide cyclase / dehydrase and lipid transport